MVKAKNLNHSILITDKHHFPAGKAIKTAFYIGQDYEIFRELAKQGVKSLHPYLQCAMEDIKDYLINLDIHFDKDPLLTLSETCGYNRYTSSLVEHVLKGKIIYDLLQKHEKILLIVDTYAEAKLYQNFIKSNDYPCNIEMPSTSCTFLILKAVKAYILNFAMQCKNITFVKRVRREIKIKIPTTLEKNLYFITWIDPSSFSKDMFWEHNRYFGDLPAALCKKLKVGIMGKILYGSASFKETVRCSVKHNTSSLFIEDFVKIRDVFISYFKSLKILFYMRRSFNMGKINFTSFIHTALIDDLINSRLANSILHYQAFKRFFSLSVSNIKIIYPFENQSWERALHLAKGVTQRKADCLAYQFFPIPENLLLHHFSKRAKSHNAIPTKILSSDLSTQMKFEKENISVSPIGSYRYNKSLGLKPAIGKNFPKKVILCCTSIDCRETYEIALKSAAATKNTGYALWVNFHPLVPLFAKEHIQRMLSIYEHVKICDQPAHQLLLDVSLVVYNASSICYDAVLAGVPCVYVESELQVNLNRLPVNVKSFITPEEGDTLIGRILGDKKVYLAYVKDLYKIVSTTILPLKTQEVEELFQ